MAAIPAIMIGIDKVDGNNVGPDPIDLPGPGPWKVEGTATASPGQAINYLAYDYDPEVPSTDIPRNNLPDWEFYLTAAMLSVLDQEYRVTVTALDDSDPPIGATTVPVTVKRPSQAPPPQPPHA